MKVAATQATTTTKAHSGKLQDASERLRLAGIEAGQHDPGGDSGGEVSGSSSSFAATQRDASSIAPEAGSAARTRTPAKLGTIRRRRPLQIDFTVCAP